MRHFSTRVVAICAALIVGVLFAGPASAQEAPSKPRVKLLLSSADRVLGDLEWIIATLAKEQGQWDQNIFPSLDIFLLGVDREKPIRFDAMIGGEDADAVNPGTYRLQPSIPVEKDGKGIRDFIKENLEPIGIDVKQRSRGGYYSLEGVYEGWMRMVADYACIGMYESDVPKDLPHPEAAHAALIASGFDIALELINTPEQTAERKEAFALLEINMLDATKAKEEESDAAFALRKGMRAQQFKRMGRIYEQARRVTIGWITDVDKELARADLYGEGLPETELAQFIDSISVEASRFASLPMSEDPAFGLRVNLPYDDTRKQQLAEWYELTRPVTHEKIDASEEITASEKEPAKQAIDLLIDMLHEGIQVGRLDLLLDMTHTDAGSHVIVAGIRATDGKKADEIVKLIPQAHTDWKVEMDAETVGDTSIHKVDISGDLPKSLSDTFGQSGAIYVATSADLVWLAGGDGSLDVLTAAIRSVQNAEPPAEVSPVFGEFKVHVHTLLTLYDSFVVEMGWNPIGKIEVQPQGPGVVGGGAGLQPIDPVEMREIALKAMEDIDDRVSGEARRIGNHAEGEILVAPGILRAFGKSIAKIAADNL